MTEPNGSKPSDPQVESNWPRRPLVRPQFFEGQILTDADLMALTAWVITKRRFATLHEGWGVVTGLWVSSTDRKTIEVSPGYAVTPNGDDIVVGDDPTTRQAKVPSKGVYDVRLQYSEEPDQKVDGFGLAPPPVGASTDATSPCCEQSAKPVVHYSRVKETFSVQIGPANPAEDVVATAFKAAASVSAEQREGWLRKLPTLPIDNRLFNPKWIDPPWPEPQRAYFYRLLRWWAEAVESGDPATVLIAQLTVKDDKVQVDQTVRRMFDRSGAETGADDKIDVSETLGMDVNEASALLTRRGVVISEWAEWPPTSPSVPQNDLKIASGQLVRVWVAKSNEGSPPRSSERVVAVESLKVQT
jgi:hypothetical protein